MIKDEFEEIYKLYVNEILRFCLSRVSDREIAKDLTQETFVRFWNHVSVGKPVDNSRVFIYTVARNAIIDHYRKKKTQSLDALSEGGFDPAGDSPSPDLSTDYRLALEAIAKLPDNYRDIVYMRLVEDLSPSEIAPLVGLPENTVSVRLYRGMDKLRAMFNQNP